MDDRTAPAFPGPAALGRGAVVDAGEPTPAALDGARRVRLDDDVLAAPQALAEVLHRDLVARRPFVVELAADNAGLRAHEVEDAPPYTLPASFAFHRERLHHLVWANTYDCRGDRHPAAGGDGPVWWHGVLAARAGADRGTDTDVVLPDGTAAWVDGGPRGPVAGLDAAVVHRESVGLGRLTATPAAGSEPGEVAGGGELAPDQRAAVLHGAGPARIIAPAGSGKTRVLTARLRHLLADRGYEPQLVTAVAYNTRAAGEMRARTAGLPGAGRSTVRTVHSLALWICTLDRRDDVIQEREVRSVLDRLVTTARIPNRDPYQPYLEALAEVRLALRDPEEVEAERDDVPGLPDVFARYREELDRRSWLDFDEQIYRAIELLLTRPDIRETAQRACTHLLVDEFQDLTPAFLLLLRLVSAPAWQVFGVGDDDQVIYGYSGASPRYLVDFADWFPGAADHPLEVNYRCPPDVVDAAATLLTHNRVRVPKTIRSGKREGAS